MKNKILYILILGFLFSCTNLDETLYSEVNESNFFKDKESVDALFLRAYEHGVSASTWERWFVEELSADQFALPQKGRHAEDGGNWRRLHRHEWNATESTLESCWDEYYKGIGFCNNAIEVGQSLNFSDLGMTKEDQKKYISDEKMLRSWFHYQLFTLFGPVVISEDTKTVNGNSTTQEVFDWLVAQINENIVNLPKKTQLNCSQVNGWEGRFSQGVAAVLLMRLYFNANWLIGKDMFSEAATVAQEIINGKYGAYDLDPRWNGPWDADNINSPELILSFPQALNKFTDEFWWYWFQNYTATNVFMNKSDYDQPWNGFCLQPSRDIYGTLYSETKGWTLGSPYEKYDDRDLRKQNFKITGPDAGDYVGMFLIGPQYSGYDGTIQTGTEEWKNCSFVLVDQIGRFCEQSSIVDNDAKKEAWIDSQMERINSSGGNKAYFIADDEIPSDMIKGEENSGIRFVKYPFYPDSYSGLQRSSCFVEYRLTEVYYTLAECKFRAGDKPAAARLINRVKERNFNQEDWGTAKYPEDGSTLTQQELLDEWGREFLGERRRRTDLLRWNVFADGTWWDKSVHDDYRTFFPIPTKTLNNNSLISPSDGYTY